MDIEQSVPGSKILSIESAQLSKLVKERRTHYRSDPLAEAFLNLLIGVEGKEAIEFGASNHPYVKMWYANNSYHVRVMLAAFKVDEWQFSFPKDSRLTEIL